MKQINNTGIVRVELNHINKGTSRILKDTIAVFRDAVSYLIHAASDCSARINAAGSQSSSAPNEVIGSAFKNILDSCLLLH